MARKWLQRFGSRRAKVADGRGRHPGSGPRARSVELTFQELENRTLLTVSASLNTGVLDVNLSASGDAATIAESGSNLTVTDQNSTVVGTFALASVQGFDVTGASVANQAVTFSGVGSQSSPLSLSQTVTVLDVTALTITGSGLDSSGNISLTVADSETGSSAQAGAQITVTDSTIDGGAITIGATATIMASDPGDGALGADLADVNVGSNATIAIGGSTSISGTGAVTIGSTSTATITATHRRPTRPARRGSTRRSRTPR